MKKGIYKITNPNGEIYVGQSKNIEKRWEQYMNNPSKHQPKLFYSFLKYGLINHVFEIIEECNNLNEREKYWINHFKSLDNGLNGDNILNSKIGRKVGYTFIYPEDAKIIKSVKMKKKWEDGEFKREWGKPILDNETKMIYNSIKELFIIYGKKPTSYPWFYKNLGDDKKFTFVLSK